MRPFGVYEYGVVIRALDTIVSRACQPPIPGEAQAKSVLEMSKEIRRKHLWIMRLNTHHEGKRGNPYDRGRTYILGKITLTVRYKQSEIQSV